MHRCKYYPCYSSLVFFNCFGLHMAWLFLLMSSIFQSLMIDSLPSITQFQSLLLAFNGTNRSSTQLLIRQLIQVSLKDTMAKIVWDRRQKHLLKVIWESVQPSWCEGWLSAGCGCFLDSSRKSPIHVMMC